MGMMDIAKFMREVRQEVSKVVWPTRREVVAMSIVVLIFVTIIALFFLLVDSIISDVIETLLSWGRTW